MKIANLIECLASALEVEVGSLDMSSTQESVEEWDSLGHISILATLDDLFSDITERQPELVDATTLSGIVEILRGESLIED